MAWYSTETVWFRGRRVDVTFRYGSYMSAHVVLGKPLHFGGRHHWRYEYRNAEERRNTRGLLRVLRRKGSVGRDNCLTYDPFEGTEM